MLSDYIIISRDEESKVAELGIVKFIFRQMSKNYWFELSWYFQNRGYFLSIVCLAIFFFFFAKLETFIQQE